MSLPSEDSENNPKRILARRPEYRPLCNLVLSVAFLLLIASPALAIGILEPRGPVAAEQQLQMLRVAGITAIAVLPVLIGVPLIVWRYRRGKGGVYRPDFAYSRALEIAMWGLPAVLVLILGGWLWHSTSRLDPYVPLGPNPLRIEVIGLDWKWLFLYPEQNLATVGSLVLPVGRPIELTLTTDTVMQSFMISALAGQIYAMPGMVTRQNLMATSMGTMQGRNTQFNGVGFSGQTVVVEALSVADFESWTQSQGKAPLLDAKAYALLAGAGTLDDARQQFAITQGNIVLNLAEPDLFNAVVNRYHKGQPIADFLQPGSPGYSPEAGR